MCLGLDDQRTELRVSVASWRPSRSPQVGREGLPSLAHCHLAFLPDRTERVPEDSGRLLCSPGSPGPGRGWSWSELSGYCGRVRQVRGVPAWKVREVAKGPWVASTGWARIAVSDSVTALCGVLLPGFLFGWDTGPIRYMLSPGTTPVDEPSLPGELQGNRGKNQKHIRHPGSWRGPSAAQVSQYRKGAGEGTSMRPGPDRPPASCLSPQNGAPPDL